jgi:hypothetical protein
MHPCARVHEREKLRHLFSGINFTFGIVPVEKGKIIFLISLPDFLLDLSH